MSISLKPEMDYVGTEQNDSSSKNPTKTQRKWLGRGLAQPGGKLPLFDDLGQKISKQTVKSCLERGWAEPWFHNPLNPNWIVCKLTEAGRKVALGD